jgi:hypothetical protein
MAMFGQGLTEEQKRIIQQNMLMQGGMGLLQAGQPTYDPTKTGLAYGLGQGMMGAAQGRQAGMAQLIQDAQMAEMQRQQELQQRLGQIPMYEQATPEQQAMGVPMAEATGIVQTEPRGMADMMGDVARTYMQYGEPEKGLALMQSMQQQRDLIESPKMYQTPEGDYRFGFFDTQGNLAKDIRAATPKEIKGTAAVSINLGKPAAASERTSLAETQASMDALKRIKDLYDASYVGPVKGRVGGVGDIFGFNPKVQSEFYAAEQSMKNAMIKAITGAQMSEPEAKRIMKQLPSSENPPSVWEARWNQSMENFKEIQKRREEVLEKSGVVSPKLRSEENIDFVYDPTTRTLR